MSEGGAPCVGMRCRPLRRRPSLCARGEARTHGTAHLHREPLAALHEPLQRAHADDVWDVVLVVGEPVQREGGVVLQVVVLGLEQVEQGHQPAALHNARLVVRVLRQPARSARGAGHACC